MGKNNLTPDLSRPEFEILRILWKQGQSSIREVHDQLDNGSSYSTTKTVMTRMVTKEILKRSTMHGVHVYESLISRPAGLAKLLRFFADSVMEIEYRTMVSMFAKNQSLTEREIEELNELIERNDKDD